ncbi:MAG: hypothetical protein EB069_10660 [Actinobacteria bacterium]|nr:hypothetical protein [Actinomycetota bacterium]
MWKFLRSHGNAFALPVSMRLHCRISRLPAKANATSVLLNEAWLLVAFNTAARLDVDVERKLTSF